jgi:hypothetical protein
VHAMSLTTGSLTTGILASGTSDNSPHGFNWTFAFPMLLFIIVATALYLLYTRPHRVPGHGELRFTPEMATEAGSLPDPGTARAAAVASGFTTAAGGGAVESVAEAAGAHRAANEDDASGTVSQDEDPAAQDLVAQGQAAADAPDADMPPAVEKPSSRNDPEASE